MDILTQIVLGGAVSSQILKDENPRKAIIAGCILGALPDLDMLLIYDVSDFEELILHRSFSHAILPFLILSFLLLYFNRSISFFKHSSPLRLFMSFFLVLLTHALLDCLTTWGTQLFWPLDTRIATQTVYVIDLIYSVVLGTGLAIFFIFSKSNLAKKMNRWTLILSSCYLVILFNYQQFFIRKVSANPSFEKAIRINTQPILFTPFKYRAVIEFPDSFMVSREVLSVFDPINGNYFSLPKNTDYLLEISEHIDLYPLYNLARGYLCIDKVKSNTYKITDLRYAPINPDSNEYESVFTYYVILNNGEAEFKQNMRTHKRLEKLFQKIFL